MKEYEVILFDLDGTLTDPGIGITNSIAYALDKFGIAVGDRRSLYKFIGPPLMESFQQFCGFSTAKAKDAIAYYREYFGETGIFENKVYDGIEGLLQGIQAEGKRAVVATSKPEAYAVRILDHFGLSRYFTFVAGSRMDGTRIQKHEVIAYALSETQVADRSSTVMVGDRKHDMIGAKKNGLESIGVLFGYGSRAELEQAEATYLAESVADVRNILLEK